MKYRSHDLRKGRASIPGAYYHIIFCTHERREVLADDKIASIIFEAFDWLETQRRIRWMCIMVMPDHVHTIIELGAEQTLAKVMHSLKRFTAREINKQLSRDGQFWQSQYRDWGIRNPESLNNMIRYCYANPVRKGIVEAARDYPYWRCKFQVE